MKEVRAAYYFTIIIDETKDIIKKEQMTFVLWYALKGVVQERFISYTYCEELNAAAMTEYIHKALQSVGLHISNCVSQCYNGASVMSGTHSGVKTRIQQENPRAIYIHCHAHQLIFVPFLMLPTSSHSLNPSMSLCLPQCHTVFFSKSSMI